MTPHHRPVRLLQTANLTGAAVLLAAAIHHAQADHWPHATAATLLVFLLVENAVRETEHARCRRAPIAERVHQLAANDTPAPALIKEQLDPARHALNTACCTEAWISRGTTHNPTTCADMDTRWQRILAADTITSDQPKEH